MSTLEQQVIFPNEVHMIIFDIIKAYDYVNLEMLNQLILSKCNDTEVLLEWKHQLQDMFMINMNVSGIKINRTRGVPQGSELSPFLFNFITSCMLEEIDKVLLDTKINIYADNWIILNDNFENLIKDYTNILDIIDKFGFKINKNEAKSLDFNTMLVGQMNPTFKDGDKVKFLGIPFVNSNNTIQIDIKKCTFTINESQSMDPHAAMLYIKKYYNPKFLYNYEILKIWDAADARLYLEWYRKELQVKLKKIAVIKKVPKILIENLINGNEDKRSNYYWYYIDHIHELKTDNNPYADAMLLRWAELAVYIKRYDEYVGIHSLINFIKDPGKRSPENYFKWILDKKNKKRTYVNMDLLFNCIITNKNMLSFMQKAQESINLERSEGFYNPFTNVIRFK